MDQETCRSLYGKKKSCGLVVTAAENLKIDTAKNSD